MNRFIFNKLAVIPLALAAFCLSTGSAQASGKAAKTILDWKILGSGTEVKSGTSYTLFNVTDNDSLRYGERTWGINLVWDKSKALNNIRFDVKGGGSKTLKYGDVVAIHVKNGGYLYYHHRDIGVNLSWSTPAKYEWVIAGGTKGTPVKVGAPLALYNQVEKDFMIFAERPAGVSLRWWKDRELAGGVFDRIGPIAEDLARWGFHEIVKEYLGKK